MKSQLAVDIKKYLDKTGLKAVQLAKIAGVHYSSIYRLLSGDRDSVHLITAEKIRKIIGGK